MAVFFSKGFVLETSPKSAIFFSQGYVLEDRPKKPIVCVGSVFVQQVSVTAYWPRDAGPC